MVKGILKDMKKLIRLTEKDLHNIIKESVNRILEDEERGGEYIFYQPQGSQEEGWSDEQEEWDAAGLNIYDFAMVKDPEIAEFHFSPEGYTIYYDGEEFGEAWYEKSLGYYRAVSDHDMFNGYTRGFEGASLNGIFEDIMCKAADAILNGDEDEEDY